MRIPCLAAVLVLAHSISFAQSGYKLPPEEIVSIVDAEAMPHAYIDPTSTRMVLASYSAYPPLSQIARPSHDLAGIRIDGLRHSRRRGRHYSGLEIIGLRDRLRVKVSLPAGSTIYTPEWSPDGNKLAFAREFDDRVELWWADARTGNATAVPGIKLNDVIETRIGVPFEWLSDSQTLLVKGVPVGTGVPPSPPSVPETPNTDETQGRISNPTTRPGLLRSKHDEELFEHFARSQYFLVDIAGDRPTSLGGIGQFVSAKVSPDGRFFLIESLNRPFSYHVPYFSFNRTIEIWDAKGARVRQIAELPTEDAVPNQGVPTGPRSIQWQAQYPSRLIWVEALDGGNPTNKVPYREQVYALDVATDVSPRAIFKIQHRFDGFIWPGTKDEVIFHERDTDRRWRTTTLVSLAQPETPRSVLFDLSWNDVYNDPGRPVTKRLPTGERVVVRDGDWLYMWGSGATPTGDQPFLDRFNLTTKLRERLFRSTGDRYEQFLSFVGDSTAEVVILSESKTEPPNYLALDLKSGRRRQLTSFKDPAPQLTALSKQLVTYSRNDGVPLSGTLYLPATYVPGTRLPCVIWAYPLEYSDAATAGQVRAALNKFTFFEPMTPLFFVTQGYAVLMDATMPIVGDQKTKNDTFVDQIIAGSKAAVDKLNTMGVIDPARVMVAGHSYGAFMTANLLAHSDLFAAGIALSGAYNRSLTPFGFQGENRSFWEATDTYMKISPFTYSQKINEPLLLIHGEADNNPGTSPIQSERLFHAIRANGGTSRIVMLPHEGHGYAARESALHAIAEMLEWSARFVKGKTAAGAAVQ